MPLMDGDDFVPAYVKIPEIEDISLLPRFLGTGGKLVPPETFSFMLDLFDDIAVLAVLDELCKLHEWRHFELEGGCGRYCSIKGVFPCLFSDPGYYACPYFCAAWPRLQELDGRLQSGARLGTCNWCDVLGIIVEVSFGLGHLRCCISCTLEQAKYGASIVWRGGEEYPATR